ncbi:hypothetical protein FISHEDRAFT_77902 [Fistulina hepatica ATCC 64428]|nr:hypothetical protein FISHEDRAFT_77902 [Fistulina hepatica ATCC 64428]
MALMGFDGQRAEPVLTTSRRFHHRQSPSFQAAQQTLTDAPQPHLQSLLIAAANMAGARYLYGPMLIGVFFNMILYGVLLVQLLLYYQSSKVKKDAAWIRLFLVYLFVAETTNTALSMYIMYEPLVILHDNPAATTYFPTLLPAQPILSVFIAAPVQMFYGWRINKITKNKYITLFICCMSLVEMAGGTWLGYTVVHVQLFSKKPELHWPAILWLLPSAISDVFITAALVYNLARRKSGFVATDTTIDHIIRLTVQTGMLTSVFAILDIVSFLVLPKMTLNFVWDFALSKLYTNALLSSLNARVGWGRAMNTHTARNVLFDNSDDIGHSNISTAFKVTPPQFLSTAGTYELQPSTGEPGTATYNVSTPSYDKPRSLVNYTGQENTEMDSAEDQPTAV